MRNENVSCQNHKSFMRKRFLIFTSSLFMSLLPKYTEPPKWLYCIQYTVWYMSVLGRGWRPRKGFGTPRWLSPIRLLEDRHAERKMVCLGYSNFCVWEQRQRPGSRFWIRKMTKREKEREKQTQKDTMKPSAPPNYFRGRVGETKASTEGQTKWWKLWGISNKMTHFFHLQRERLLIKATYNIMPMCESFFLLFSQQLHWKSYGT